MSSESSMAAVLHGIRDLRVEPVEVPDPKPHEVQLAMRSVGICGSDVHYWTHGEIGDFKVLAPMVLGHEASGVVIKVGSEVRDFAPGDRVAIEPGVPCMACAVCRGGRYNLCPEMKFCATPPIHGSLSNRYNHSAQFCYRLPDTVSFDEAALLEPLSVAVHATRRGGVGPGSSVLVCGAGPVGLLCMLVAKACGASRVGISDIAQARLDVAKSLGADVVFNVGDPSDESAFAERVGREFASGPTTVLECSGAERSVRAGILSVKPGGCFVLVGMGKPDMQIPLLTTAIREVDIRGVFRYANCYGPALALVASGAIDVKSLVTHRFALNKAKDAFEKALDGKDVIKIIIDCAST